MLNLAKILLPVDFSERCLGAARYAGLLACRFRSELTMLHVVPANDYTVASMEMAGRYTDWWHDRVDEAKLRLGTFLAEELRGIPVTRIIREGDPARQIVEMAHSDGTNLIVMPTHGYGPFRRFILGSVTTKVLHDADCPVFTGVHLEEGPPFEVALFRNILCAIDLGAQSRTALAWAVRMAAELEARLHIVHALPAIESGQAHCFDQGWRTAVERTGKERIGELLAEDGVQADVILDNGDVSKVVRGAAQSANADLIVIGRHAGSGILGRLRAHACSIIRESPCPVISV